MKKLFILFFIFLLVSCSKISGKYDKFSEGWLGQDNSLSTYDFGMFGQVTYSLSTSGSRSSNYYKSFSGNYKIDGNQVVLNFGGSDRVLKINANGDILTDSGGNIFKKR